MVDLETRLASLITALGADVKALQAHGEILLDKVHPSLGTGTSTTIGNVNVNTAAEVTLGTLTVPAVKVVSGDQLRLEFGIDLYNNSTAAMVYTFKVKINGTTVFTGTPSIPNSVSNRYRGIGRFGIGLATLSDQRIEGFILMSAAVAANNMIGLLAVANENVGEANTTFDLSSDATITITAQMASAHANADVRLTRASITRVR